MASPEGYDPSVLLSGLLPTTRRGWVEQAACRDADPELFFPVGTAGPAVEQVRAAKAVCTRCPVIADCLEWALDTGQDYGVWGGSTPEERREMRRRSRARRTYARSRGR